MSIVEPTLFSLARAALVAAATFVLLLIAGPGVQSWPRKLRAGIFWVAMAALLAPGFGVAFHFYKSVMSEPESLERSYCLFVLARCLPISMLALWLFPPAMSKESLHTLQCSRQGSWFWRRICEMRAWGGGLWIGCAIAFLLAFQEFEVATTWNVRAWTVALFDAQAGGLALGQSLWLVLPPLAIQAAVIALLCIARRAEPLPAMELQIIRGRSVLILFPLIYSFAFALFPAAVLIGRVPGLFNANTPMLVAPWREILNAIVISSAATFAAWIATGWIESGRRWRRLIALPGLLGPLLTGLLLLAMMQLPPLHLLRDTIVPAVLGLALVLLPYALLLRFGIETTQDSAALHIARASGARRAVWLLDGFPRLCAVLLIFCFGYGDFTINTLLAPPQFTSASVRLLNLLHYGQSAALTVMFTLAFAVPFSAGLLTAALSRLYARRRVR